MSYSLLKVLYRKLCSVLILSNAYTIQPDPFNMMRNLARESCGKATYLLMLDADLEVFGNIVSLSLAYSSLLERIPEAVVVIPTFELDKKMSSLWSNADELSAPYATKEGIHSLWNAGVAHPFNGESFPAGHRATNFTRWFTSESEYIAEYEAGYEPYLLLRSSIKIQFDESFVGFGYDKVSFIMELQAAGYKFVVFPMIYAVSTHVHEHRLVAQLKDKEVSTTTGLPCPTDLNGGFNRNIIGGNLYKFMQ